MRGLTGPSWFLEFQGARLIRTLHQKAPKENGIHRIYWSMNEKGADRPSRKIRKRTNEPRGVSVKPGTYNLKMSFGNQTSESSIKVEFDPRLEMSKEAITEIYNASKDMEKDQQLMADVVKQLVESKNIANGLKSRLNKLDKDKFKDEIKLSSEMVKQTDSLVALFLGKIDKRQGITRNKESNVQEKIYKAYYYISSRPNGNTITETNLMKHANNSLSKAIKVVNAFFKEKWKSYREQMDKLEYSEFKETIEF